jgi:UDP-N-acetylmuramate dehydrogenase
MGIMATNVPSQNEKINLERMVTEHLDLTRYSTMHLHTTARYGAFPTTLEELRALLSWASTERLPVTVIGGGSNSLFSDRGIDGLVIITTGMNHFHINGEMFCVRCGMNLESAIDHASEAGLAGLEMLGGIPGTVGGAIWGNSGVSTIRVSSCLYYVDYLTMDGKLHRMQVHNDDFSYRYSPFMEMPQTILFEAAFRLTPTRQTAQLRIIKEGTKARRREQHQFDWPSVGCIFKNPPDVSAGALLDQAGMKGKRIGGAMVSPYHANFIVNPEGNATGQDIWELARQGREAVEKNTGIHLEFEVNFLGQW